MTQNNHQLGKFAKSLRQGQTIYVVYALGDGSYMETLVVCSRATQYKIGKDYFTYGIFTKYAYDGKYSNPSMQSLSDMNGLIGLNGYNNHRVFFSKKKAQKYHQQCLRDTSYKPFGVLYDYGSDYHDYHDYYDGYDN